jgi:hypothetical protein
MTAPPNMIRLGPLPAGEPFRSLPKTTVNGVAVYTAVLHGPISGPAFLAPALGVEFMAAGPDRKKVVESIGASVRSRVMAYGPRVPPPGWAHISFAGLSFAVLPAWATIRTDYGYDCKLEQENIALGAPSTVFLDTDTNELALPCPYLPAPRTAADRLVVEIGSAHFANTVPPASVTTPVSLNGLPAYVDRSCSLAVLVLYIDVPGRTMPVKLSVGLGDPLTVKRVLGSIRASR